MSELDQEKSNFLFALCIFSKRLLLTDTCNLSMYSLTTCKCYHKESLHNIELKQTIYFYIMCRSRKFRPGLFSSNVLATFMLKVMNLCYIGD